MFACTRPRPARQPRRAMILCLLCLCLGASASAAGPAVWSALPASELEPVLSAYTAASGTTASLVCAPFSELMARYLAVPAADKPDLLIGASIQDIATAGAAGLLAPLGPAVPLPPEMWRDPDGRWLALTYSPLGLVYAPARVNPQSLATYEALAEGAWKGRLALPSGRSAALSTLAGYLKARYGAANAGRTLAGFAANLARPAAGDAEEAIAAVDAGAADVALADAPALARYLLAHQTSRLGLHWPNQRVDGALVTATAAGVPQAAPHAAAGNALLAWLLSPAGQKALTAASLAYPVIDNVPTPPLPTSFGAFRLNLVPVEVYARLEPEARALLAAAGL